QEMVQRFLLDGIDTEAGRPTVSREDDLVVCSHTHEAEAGLPFVQRAGARAHVAADSSVVEARPPGRGIAALSHRYRALYHAPPAGRRGHAHDTARDDSAITARSSFRGTCHSCLNQQARILCRSRLT